MYVQVIFFYVYLIHRFGRWTKKYAVNINEKSGEVKLEVKSAFKNIFYYVGNNSYINKKYLQKYMIAHNLY